MMRELTGYKSGNSRPGIRKHVVVLSLNSFCNTATEMISHAVRGTIPLVHPLGRNEIGIYRERLERSLMGVVLHPNVHAVLVVGYEPKSTMEFVETVRKTTSKQVEPVLVLEGGTWNAVRIGMEKALDMVLSASEVCRKTIELKRSRRRSQVRRQRCDLRGCVECRGR